MAPRASNELGVHIFRLKVFREQMHGIEESTCGIVGAFRHQGQCAPFSPLGTPLTGPKSSQQQSKEPTAFSPLKWLSGHE